MRLVLILMTNNVTGAPIQKVDHMTFYTNKYNQIRMFKIGMKSSQKVGFSLARKATRYIEEAILHIRILYVNTVV